MAAERELLVASYRAAVAAADPLKIVPAQLPKPPRGRTLAVGAGKAAASMAAALEAHWPAGAPLSGLVITRYGHGLPTGRIRVVEAGHPIPDESGERAAREILSLARGLGPDDLLLALVSGGGSALLSAPVDGVSMAELKGLTAQLLRSGATIQEINTVRKHLSAIQGGRLAAACRAPAVALIISDVVGDEPTHIASGPCAPDPTTCADAEEVTRRFGISFDKKKFQETPKPGDASFARVENRVIATAMRSLHAAGEVFRARGIEPVNLGDRITGEAAEVGRAMAELARARLGGAPSALVSGGECTVTLGDAAGRGGRNAEFALALAIALGGAKNVWALAAGTDGIDGTEDNAGAVIAPDTISRAGDVRLDPRDFLERHDSYSFFQALGDLVVTGPTRTNVNDYRAILVT